MSIMRFVIFAIATASLCACQGSPCTQYTAARDTCYADHDRISLSTDSSAYCRDFTSSSDDYFTCLADAYVDADCSTDKGFEDAIAAATACSME